MILETDSDKIDYKLQCLNISIFITCKLDSLP